MARAQRTNQQAAAHQVTFLPKSPTITTNTNVDNGISEFPHDPQPALSGANSNECPLVVKGLQDDLLKLCRTSRQPLDSLRDRRMSGEQTRKIYARQRLHDEQMCRRGRSYHR
jgi:hypothetical protein